MKIGKLLFCVVGGVGLSGACFGQITYTKAGYLLRARYPKGLVLKYDSLVEVLGTGNFPKVHVPLTLNVVKVVGTAATIKLTKGAVMVAGTVIQPAESITFPLDNRNRGIDKAGQAIGPPMPLKPLKPGVHWEATLPVNLLGKMTPMNASYTFNGMKQVGGHSLGVIIFVLTGAVKGQGTMYIRSSDGTMENSDMKLSIGAGPGAVNQVRVVVKRL